jgi:membrane protein
LRLFWNCCKEAWCQFQDSDGWAISSHIALSFMIAVFPFLIFATTLAGFFGGSDLTEGIVNLVFEAWPDRISGPIVSEVNVVLGQRNSGFMTFGIVLALVFAANGVESVRVALNRAYKVEERRPILKQYAQSFLFVFIGSTLLTCVSSLLVFIPLYFNFVADTSPSLYRSLFGSEILRVSSAFLLLVFVVFSCHYWLPARRQRLSQIWPGVLLTLILWTLATTFFATYLRIFANYSATYAGLAGVMTAQIFLYIIGAILIYGAEFNAALERAGVLKNWISEHKPQPDNSQ